MNSRTLREFDQLGAGRSQALVVRPEINEHADSLLNTDDRAEAVLVVGHPVIDRVTLGLLGGTMVSAALKGLPGRWRRGRAR